MSKSEGVVAATSNAAKSTRGKKETGNNQLGRTGAELDHLYVAAAKKDFSGTLKNLQWDAKQKALVLAPARAAAGKPVTATFTSEKLRCKFPAQEFLPSWNILLHGPGQGFRLSMRFYNNAVKSPSPWLLVGEGGQVNLQTPVKTEAAAWGKTRIDYIDLQRPAHHFQYRIELFVADAAELAASPAPGIHRLFVHYSGQGKASAAAAAKSAAKVRASHISVPYRSQLTVEKKDLRNIICCPTSLSMVLEFNGVNRPTLDVCADAYDARYKIYGVWPRVSHVAFQHGFKSWVGRFRSHGEVHDWLAEGQPIIASIRVKEGELRGAKYGKSNGHIIVITGIAANGNYIVNDPASAGPDGAEIEYDAADMEKVWLDKGGVAVLIKPESN